jgi:Ca-activated chloride channel family protein
MIFDAYTCFGGGILHVFPPSLQDKSIAVARPTVLVSRTAITVSESYIEYRIDQTFFNDNEFPLAGIFLLPMPERQRAETIDIRVDGVPYPAQIMSPDTFFPVLSELTTSMRDPSLMGLAGKNVAVVRPVQIGIRGQKSFKCQFKIPTHIEKDLLNVYLPLDGERYSLGPVGEMDIWVRMKMERTVRNIFSPTHNLTITRESSNRYLALAKSVEKRIRDDFRVVVSFSAQDPDLQILTHRSPGEKGTFMAMISPPLDMFQNRQPHKDVVFVLDSSKSIGISEFALAKRAIISGLQRLGSGDRFNVLVIDTRPRSMSEQFLAMSEENVAQAVRFVNSVQEGGGTDLCNTLINSVELFSSRRRVPFVVLVGSGRGTVGVTNPDAIIEDLRKYNKFRARIFTLGIGRHLDVALLDRLAASTKGISLNHMGKEDFESLLNRFYSGVAPPNLSDISLEFLDISPEEIEPETIPDQLGTGSVIVLGRYSENHDSQSRVRLKTRVQGRLRTLTSTFDFPEVELNNSFLPGIWAMRRVARLLEKEWLRGTESEHMGQLPLLAKQFGFKLPPQAVQYGGAQQRHSSNLLWHFKTSFSKSDVQADGCRIVDGRLFRLSPNGVWVDQDYHLSSGIRVVEFLGEDYFSLAKESPALGSFMSIGTDIILVHNKQAIRIKSDSGPAMP